MSSEIRLERVTKRTFRIRSSHRNAQDPVERAAAREAPGFRFASLSRFASGAQKRAHEERITGS